MKYAEKTGDLVLHLFTCVAPFLKMKKTSLLMVCTSYIVVFPKNTARLEQRLRAKLATNGLRLRQYTGPNSAEAPHSSVQGKLRNLQTSLVDAWKSQAIHAHAQAYIIWKYPLCEHETSKHVLVDMHTAICQWQKIAQLCSHFGGEFFGAFLTEENSGHPYFLSKDMCQTFAQTSLRSEGPHTHLQGPSLQLCQVLEAAPRQLSSRFQAYTHQQHKSA